MFYFYRGQWRMSIYFDSQYSNQYSGQKSVRPEGLVGGPLFRRWSSADWISSSSSFIPPERERKEEEEEMDDQQCA
jgi:hypothetical protein